ncbi:anthrone oxygenase family protein [Pseudarthrobacter sp. TAF60_1]|uniref:anthrone oxygenase family protein n=1 Tax=Pseudarthrobacter sp. TAF60_1 TaxID=3233071 RepID=UPI003F9CF693
MALALYTATLVITVCANIPLNIRLGSVGTSEHAGAGREFLERRWTRWNIYRTWLSLATLLAPCIAWRRFDSPLAAESAFSAKSAGQVIHLAAKNPVPPDGETGF